MIIVKISGGLGNQMFQFAMLYMLQKIYPQTDVFADVSSYKLYDVHYGMELDTIFHLCKKNLLSCASPIQQYKVRGEIPMFCGGGSGKLLRNQLLGLMRDLEKFSSIFIGAMY